MKLAALRASIAAVLAVSTASLLAPQAASALDFTFSFGGVSGLITGLVDNTANQVAGVTVSVLNSGTTSAPVGTYTYTEGSGFTVSSGAVQTASWAGFGAANLGGPVPDLGGVVIFQYVIAVNIIVHAYIYLASHFVQDAAITPPPESVAFVARQQPASSVPGPLPLFGTAAAFGFSRKLRKRIKSSGNSVSSSSTYGS